MKIFYRRCNKCGIYVKIELVLGDQPTNLCLEPMPNRTSGVCGGAYEEITEEEYVNQIPD